MRLTLRTTLLLITSLAVAGCGGSSHHSTRASSPVRGPSGHGHAQRVSRHGVAPPGSPAPAARTAKPSGGPQSGPAAARAAARTFLEGWLLYEYGHAKAAVMKDVTPTFRTTLADYPPDIPPTPTSRHLYAHLISLTLERRRGSSWRARAHITDGHDDTFDETVQLIHPGGHWLVDFIIANP